MRFRTEKQGQLLTLVQDAVHGKLHAGDSRLFHDIQLHYAGHSAALKIGVLSHLSTMGTNATKQDTDKLFWTQRACYFWLFFYFFCRRGQWNDERLWTYNKCCFSFISLQPKLDLCSWRLVQFSCSLQFQLATSATDLWEVCFVLCKQFENDCVSWALVSGKHKRVSNSMICLLWHCRMYYLSAVKPVMYLLVIESYAIWRVAVVKV